MHCPVCLEVELTERPTRQGVVIESCARCDGTWLDRGKIFLFSSRPRAVEALLSSRVRAQPHDRQRCCPRCTTPLVVQPFLAADIEVDECPSCEGMWFDAGEFRRVVSLPGCGIEITPADRVHDTAAPPKVSQTDPHPHEQLSARGIALRPLPYLMIRSVLTLTLLYGILGAVLIGLVESGWIDTRMATGIGIAIIVMQWILAPWLMDLMLGSLYRIQWVPTPRVPKHLRLFMTRVTQAQGMTMPRFGIIPDGAPNAFTYGHTPKNMRLVVTRGIFQLLEPGEVEAIVAHELGHGKHWDVLLMTVAQLVPFLLYYVTKTLTRAIERRRGSSDTGEARMWAAIGIYLLYIISQYLVLSFSRCRELHADRFAGEITGNPNLLASALVKVAYGLAAPSRDHMQGAQSDETLEAISALGIFDAHAAKAVVMTASAARKGRGSHAVRVENIKRAMQWDLWNPWAKFYELLSTHPLIAHRLQILGDQSASMGIEPYVVFDRRKPESYWDDFLVDVVVLLLPLLVFPGLIGVWVLAPLTHEWPGKAWFYLCIAALGIASLAKTFYTYRRGVFPPMSIAALSHVVKVSRVRPVPATLKGTVIGRGVPGLIWSEDFVMRDATGLLFLDYRQPLRIWEWIFGLTRAGDFTGREVVVSGWYRRAPVPYLEIREFTIDGQTRRCYSYRTRVAFATFFASVGTIGLAYVI